MKINFIEPEKESISVNKLFEVLKQEFSKRGLEFTSVRRESGKLSIGHVLRNLNRFRKNQSANAFNHITGGAHWAILSLKGRKTIITVHDIYGVGFKSGGIKQFFYFLIWFYIPLSKARYIVAVSEKTKDEIYRLVPWVRRKVVVIHNCLTAPLIAHTALKNNDIPKLLIVGIAPRKNIERAARALKGLEVRLTILGSINLSKEEAEALDTSGVDYRFFLCPTDSEVTALYAESDILLYPTLYEGFGLPILEAQAQNVLVVTSDIRPTNEICGEAAILVDPHNTESIRDGVLKALNLTNEEKLDLLLRGKQNVMNYTPELIASKYIDLYKKIEL